MDLILDLLPNLIVSQLSIDNSFQFISNLFLISLDLLINIEPLRLIFLRVI
jgi:hypothetical protein